MGSGKRLRYSIRKYGVENHTKEILEFLDDRESLAKREKEIVNEGLINDPLCMNLQLGGGGGAPPGGGGFISEEHQLKAASAGGKANAYKMKNDLLFRERTVNKMRNSALGNKNAIGNKSMSGQKHSDETLRKIKESKKGQKGQGVGSENSQYGTCWITNEIINKKMYKGDLIPNGWRLGRKV